MSQPLQAEVWKRLLSGESLDGLSLLVKAGRIDLSGFRLPEPRVVSRWQARLADVTEVEADRIFRRVRWRDLDFSGSTLNSLQFYDSEITNCCFDRCRLGDFQPFATTIRDSSFRGADLRGAGLGIATESGPLKLRRNIYNGIDFTDADLRQTLYISASFEHCTFRNSKLAKLNFASSTFSDCRFEGELREVRFWRSDLPTCPWFPQDAFPPNEMTNVDFSHAKLRDVEFRGINLERVRLPVNKDHIIIHNFAATLDKVIDCLKKEGDETARILLASLEVHRSGAAPYSPGVLNRLDLAEAGDGAVERVLRLLSQFETKVQ